MQASSNSRWDLARGQSLVELALMLPVLLMILVGVLDLGRVYYSYITVVNAAREGARYGATAPTDSNGITSHARNEAAGSGVNPSDMSVTSVCLGPGSSCDQGNPIKVTVSYNFHLITTYLFGGGAVPLQAAQQFVIFGQ